MTKRNMFSQLALILILLGFSMGSSGCSKRENSFFASIKQWIQSLSLKDSGMTDEDYIKINVRIGYEMQAGAMINDPFEMLKRSGEITRKIESIYGYSDKAEEKKYNEIHSTMSKRWVSESVVFLRDCALGRVIRETIGLPSPCTWTGKFETEQDWQKFFIDNDRFLHQP